MASLRPNNRLPSSKHRLIRRPSRATTISSRILSRLRIRRRAMRSLIRSSKRILIQRNSSSRRDNGIRGAGIRMRRRGEALAFQRAHPGLDVLHDFLTLHIVKQQMVGA